MSLLSRQTWTNSFFLWYMYNIQTPKFIIQHLKQTSPLSLLYKHGGQVRHLHGGKYLVQIRRHVALLQQRRPQVGPLRPFGNLATNELWKTRTETETCFWIWKHYWHLQLAIWICGMIVRLDVGLLPKTSPASLDNLHHQFQRRSRDPPDLGKIFYFQSFNRKI